MSSTLLRPPTRPARSRVFDSARWDHYRPRVDDIVIGTYSKCGTTWMQRIVGMLVFQTAEPMPIWDLSPWFDMRLFGPVEDVCARAEAQAHRRFLKTHLPFDALPVYAGVKFIHVARDGRDAAMSLHNHLAHFTAAADDLLNGVSRSDPKFGDDYPPVPQDAAEFFHDWITDGGGQGDEGTAFFHLERSYWAERHAANMLLVHYNDLKHARGEEMRRVAAFLGINIAEELWPRLIEAASFESMRAQGGALIPAANTLWDEGPNRFLNKGTNGRWKDVFRSADVESYRMRVQQEFSPALARWLEQGRLIAGDPRLS